MKVKKKAYVIILISFINLNITAQTNYASLKSVEAFPNENPSQLSNITDGYVHSQNIWSSTSEILDRNLIIDLTADFKIRGMHIYIPQETKFPPKNILFQYYENGNWISFKVAKLEEDASKNIRVIFETPINTTKVKLVFPNSSNLLVSEICVWGNNVPPIDVGVIKEMPQEFIANKHWICVNQVAYNKNAPKGFTVPTASSNLEFSIIETKSHKVVFKGKLKDKKGNFTSFKPDNSKDEEYIIRVKDDSLGNADSYPFVIGNEAIQKMSYKAAVDFMNDSRSMVGTHPSAYGGTPWRDGAYYTFEVPSMVMMYLSNQKLFNEMPVTMDWNKERDFILSSKFKPTKEPSDEKAVEIVKTYYRDLQKPKDLMAPDIIQAIRYGIGWYLIDPVTKDPSGDPLGWHLHSQTVEQFAYFLYGYPAFQQYISNSFYNDVLKTTLRLWNESGLFNVITKVGTPKGRHCVGHSIFPNLLMYEVAKREKLENADKFLNAAIKQTEWVIEHVDWKNPKFTKGQRISEARLITGITHFQYNYPDLAPIGLKNKINDWAKEIISLSNNEWDFRRYDLTKNWTLPEYNEAGNVIGFPACALSVAMVINDKKTKERLVEIAYAHIDNFNGRNPANAHCANHPENGFIGVENGWPHEDVRRDVCARLETVRGALCSLPGSEMYPFNPLGRPRHGEGWTVYNANWNLTLAYLNFYEGVSSLNVLKK